jgi:hypothetical protein
VLAVHPYNSISLLSAPWSIVTLVDVIYPENRYKNPHASMTRLATVMVRVLEPLAKMCCCSRNPVQADCDSRLYSIRALFGIACDAEEYREVRITEVQHSHDILAIGRIRGGNCHRYAIIVRLFTATW